jgi:hypothetical protein
MKKQEGGVDFINMSAKYVEIWPLNTFSVLSCLYLKI